MQVSMHQSMTDSSVTHNIIIVDFTTYIATFPNEVKIHIQLQVLRIMMANRKS